MKKLWSVILLIGLVNAQMPEPTMVGQDKLQVPTLSINNFVNQAEIEGREESRAGATAARISQWQRDYPIPRHSAAFQPDDYVLR